MKNPTKKKQIKHLPKQSRPLLRTPLDVLLPYQRKWVLDNARFKIGLMSRQVGKSFSTAAEVIACEAMLTGEDWVVLSTGERQALEWMKKAQLWVKACDFAVESYEEDREDTEHLLKQAEIRLSNGATITAVPANPRTVRGYNANLVLDEFAHQESPNEIWKAIYPSITNPLNGIKKIRIISTANGKDNKFYSLWSHNNNYTKHLVTIYDAVKQGLPVDINALRQALDDEDAWKQEYLCEFLQSSSILLPYETIEQAEELSAGDGHWDGAEACKHYIGIDIGRKHDLTVAWVLEDRGTYLHTVEIIELKDTPFHTQQEVLEALIKRRTVHAVSIDCTGIGMMLSEELRRTCGGKVEGVNFSNVSKNDIFLRLQRAFEKERVKIPISRLVREDLHSLQRMTSAIGTVRILAPRNEDGHADRATALALALNAVARACEGHSCVGKLEMMTASSLMEGAFASYNHPEGGILL